MPGMSQCTVYHNVCTASPLFFQCPVAQPAPRPLPPSMKMYFHLGLNEYFLFETFVPQNYTQYICACVFVFLTSLLYEYSSVVFRRIENADLHGEMMTYKVLKPSCVILFEQEKLRNSDEIRSPLIENSSSTHISNSLKPVPPLLIIVKQRGFRSVLRFFNVILSYSLMLLAMTFNVGVIMSISLGFAVGHFLFAEVQVTDDVGNVGDECCT